MSKDALIAGFVTALICGCTTVTIPPGSNGTRIVSSGEEILGNPDEVTTHDLDASAKDLAGKMLASSLFVRNYEAAKARKQGALPVVVCGNISNLTTQRIQGLLDTARDHIRIALMESALVEAKDDEASGAIVSRILSGADGGMEDGSLAQTLGTHDSPDFLLLGDFRHFEDVGGYHTFKLHLALHDLSTGKIVWEGIQTKIKL